MAYGDQARKMREGYLRALDIAQMSRHGELWSDEVEKVLEKHSEQYMSERERKARAKLRRRQEWMA